MKDCRQVCFLMLALSIVGGCATMSESECINADWREIGRNDGLEGKRQTELARHYDACVKYGITPEREKYMEGRELGLTIYCTQDSGYWEGRNGASYRRVCPASSASAFLAGYRAGQTVYNAIERVRSVRADIASVKDSIGSLEDDIRKLESGDEESEADDKETAGDIEDKRKEIGRLDDELESLRVLRALAIAEYARAIERANGLGYPEEFLLDEVL